MKIFLLCLLLISFNELFSAQNKPEVSYHDLIKTIFNTTETGSNNLPIQTKTTISDGSSGKIPDPTVISQNQGPDLVTERIETYQSCGFEKECVPRYLCENNSLNTNGNLIIDIKSNSDGCEYLKVCCDISNQKKKSSLPSYTHNEGCGYRNLNGAGFKISGDNNNEAQFGEFPWMVAILREEDADEKISNLYECGGALITPTVILTAAHCVQNRLPKSLVIRAGEWDTQTMDEVRPHQDRSVSEIIIHEDFNKGSLFNDVALLIVHSSFALDDNVKPVCLPTSDVIFDKSRCFATGWGIDKFGREGYYQTILKKVDLPIVPQEECIAYLRQTRLGNNFNLDRSFICAGGEKGKDTCKGDGGSPLVCPIAGTKNRYFQAGIVAWGIDCGKENVPGLYANIPYLRHWIDEKLSSKHIDFSYFTP